MADQFERLRGIVNFWVAGEGVLSWYPDAPKKLQERGDIIWSYGGTPPVEHVSSEITLNPLRSWITGVQGFVRWQTVAPGPDPWEGLQGGGETLVYPGDRFGLDEPLASIRLKLQRNCLQDLALLQARTRTASRETVLSEVVRRYNGTSLGDWRNTAPALPRQPVLEWNNLNIDEALASFKERFSKLQPDAWLRVREYALNRAAGTDGDSQCSDTLSTSLLIARWRQAKDAATLDARSRRDCEGRHGDDRWRCLPAHTHPARTRVHAQESVARQVGRRRQLRRG